MTGRLKIGIDATFRLYGGSLTHLRALLRCWRSASVDHSILVFAAPQNVALLREFAGTGVQVVEQPSASSRGRRLVWFHTAFPAAIDSALPDVMLFPGGYMPARGVAAPSVVIFRNAAPFCEAVTWKRVGWRYRLAFALLGQQMRLSARRATKLIFPSRFLLDVFVRRYGIDEARATVLYHGHDAWANPSRAEAQIPIAEGDRFILCISHLYRYKNIDRLIEGYHGALGAIGARKLVVAGDFTDREYGNELRALIDKLNLRNQVVLTGAVGREALPGLIDRCDFFVFPSVCENCPNTLIEVMAAGKALAVSDKASMPEICGDAALYYDPDDPEEIGAAMTELCRNDARRVELETAATKRAATFPTWNDVGLQTLRELEAACGRA